MADFLIIYAAFGWLVGVLFDLYFGQSPNYSRLIPIWPVALLALIIAAVADKLDIAS